MSTAINTFTNQPPSATAQAIPWDHLDQFARGDFSSSEYVQKANALLPVLRDRAAQQWGTERILDETIRDMQKAGFFQMFQSKHYGGAELSPIETFEVTSILAEADASVAWVLGVLGIHTFHLSYFTEKAQQEVLGENPQMLINSPYAPRMAKRVAGGFRISGQWSFASGSDHCGWSMLGANVEGEENPQQGGPMGKYVFLLPREDYEILHNWQVHGLKATGSNDIIVKDAFIPEHRALEWSAVLDGTAPGLLKNSGLLYQLPFLQVFSRATQAPSALGALRGMAQNYLDYMQSRPSNGKPTNPAATLAVADILVSVDEMKTRLYSNYAEVIDATINDRQIPPDIQMNYRFQSARIPARCAQLATELYRVIGGTGIYMDRPFGRQLADIQAIQTHAVNAYQSIADQWVGPLLSKA